jgi:hypothetical protein
VFKLLVEKSGNDNLVDEQNLLEGWLGKGCSHSAAGRKKLLLKGAPLWGGIRYQTLPSLRSNPEGPTYIPRPIPAFVRLLASIAGFF